MLKKQPAHVLLILITTTLFFSLTFSAPLSGKAEEVYSHSKMAVYQIRVLDSATKEKVVIGSGFRFSADGYIATNYHVISKIILHPNRYLLECLHEDGRKESLELIDTDIVNDVAILKSKLNSAPYLKLSNTTMPKGKRIYSMGNPRDLGMTIVEGNYNGLIEESMYKRILFSGSLNPGMSGGPALDKDGRVIGINVSTYGQQLSFFVPITYLQILFNDVKKRGGTAISDWNQRLLGQLSTHQQQQVDKILSKPWKTVLIGDVSAPGQIDTIFKCWAETEDKDDSYFKRAYYYGSSTDLLYLDEDLQTGKIEFSYLWFEGKQISSLHFYSILSRFFMPYKKLFHSNKQDINNFNTRQSFIKINGSDWKISFSTREFKKFKNLYEVYVTLVSVSEKKKGITIHLSLLGITKDNAIRFVDRFLENISWQK
ncbi:MAG: hypothetical protein A2Y40_01480 [Candidatus Margulisbacteria bacterium GWF2_35_9]|nr:MAG: hypothetical protein A2Y40_01480 [Candidatus Margulisbacteria bacterium GWF2_35_9]